MKTTLKQNPKLCQRELKDGRVSLYLEYYLGRSQEPLFDEQGNPLCYSGTTRQKYKIYHVRKKENLNIYLYKKPKTTEERSENRKNISLANEVRSLREQEYRAGKLGVKFAAKSHNFHDFAKCYIDRYSLKDKRMVICSYKRFVSFLNEYYPMLTATISPEVISKQMMEKFSSYLQGKSKGEGAMSYFKRWKKILNAACEDNIFEKNPCDGISCGVSDDSIKKDILSSDEVVRLLETTYEGQNNEVRRAFGFSLYSGVRFVDVCGLKYCDIDLSCNVIRFEQAKTKGHSKASIVIIPLSPMLMEFIGQMPNDRKKKVFNLPSHTMCLKALRHWTKKAGIDKHITWHCARHTFATLILSNGANPKVTADLLGHSSMKYVERYVRAIDKAKIDAVNSLPCLHKATEK